MNMNNIERTMNPTNLRHTQEYRVVLETLLIWVYI